MSVRELRERRAELHTQNQKLLDRAKAAGRSSLTREEAADFDRRDAEIAALGEEITRLDNHERTGRELSMSAGTIVGINGMAAGMTRGAHDVGEKRIFAPDESIAEHRGFHGAPLDIGIGDFCRAMVLGPRNEREERALAEGTDSAGGFTVPDPLAGRLIDRLRKRATVIRAGAQTVPMSADTLSIARLATDATASWRVENATISASDPTLERVLFTARSLTSHIKSSRELLDDSININSAIETTLTNALALELDRVALVGSGTAPEPRGIANTSGVGSVSMGTNGGQLTSYDKLLDAWQTLQDANAPEPTAAILAPRTSVALAKLKDTTNQPLVRPQTLQGVTFMPTTQIGVADTQGTANNASRIIMGDFSQLMLGIRSEIRIEVLKERYVDNFQYGFLCWMRADVQLVHPESFVQVIGIIP